MSNPYQLIGVITQSDFLGVGDLTAPVGVGEGAGQVVQIGTVGFVQLGAGDPAGPGQWYFSARHWTSPPAGGR